MEDSYEIIAWCYPCIPSTMFSRLSSTNECVLGRGFLIRIPTTPNMLPRVAHDQGTSWCAWSAIGSFHANSWCWWGSEVVGGKDGNAGVLDDVRPGASHLRLHISRRVATFCPQRKRQVDHDEIQGVNTEYYNLYECVYSLSVNYASLTRCRAHGGAQFARPAGVGEAQRGAGMLHHHTRAGHPSVGVS